jgi:hypothetical protein
MYLLYLDESGAPNSWRVQNHFVLGGIAVHEGQTHILQQRLDAIQKQHFPDIHVPLPFHATDIREGIDRYRLKQKTEREEILTEVYRVITSMDVPNVIVFAVALSVDSAHNREQVLHDSFEEICSEFNNYLIWQARTGTPSKGLLIMDERERVREYRGLLDNLMQSGTKYGYLGNIADIPYFARSPETRMLQLADFVANAVFRYYENRENKYLDMIMPCIARKPTDHRIYGLRHITINRKCRCCACYQP